jgi:hypothetical protein
MVAAFGLAIARQRWRSQTGRDGAGSKGQRRPLVLPFLHQQYPGMMAIHLVRDGRAMAYANNQDRQRCLRHIAIGAASRLLPRPIQSTKVVVSNQSCRCPPRRSGVRRGLHAADSGTVFKPSCHLERTLEIHEVRHFGPAPLRWCTPHY